ncbi:MAG: HD domain-containing protein, partial [Betaproteobacteria bacterium AqS2]|nr:HD domain-containing protein [Betaproteobacteria bacterium AqS2]
MALKNRLLPEIRRVSRLEHIVKGLLPAKPDRFKTPIRIHDSIWGEIELEPHEASLINTPLLQRLRRIKQLGSGHLVFPGATHTRFEHSLGVLEQASRMCDGLNEGRRGRARLVTAEQRINLRFAALCHDLGHGPFSHYSEMFYPQLPAHRKKGEPKNAEELSALIVTSEPFGDFCRAVGRMHGVKLNPRFIAAAITGDLPARQKYLGEIIHGPFDADKIRRPVLRDADQDRHAADPSLAHHVQRQAQSAAGRQAAGGGGADPARAPPAAHVRRRLPAPRRAHLQAHVPQRAALRAQRRGFDRQMGPGHGGWIPHAGRRGAAGAGCGCVRGREGSARPPARPAHVQKGAGDKRAAFAQNDDAAHQSRRRREAGGGNRREGGRAAASSGARSGHFEKLQGSARDAHHPRRGAAEAGRPHERQAGRRPAAGLSRAPAAVLSQRARQKSPRSGPEAFRAEADPGIRGQEP